MIEPSLPETPSLRDLAGFFLRLGVTAFGGPAAHIAMMEDEVVHRRRWLGRDQFVDLVGAANLLPGPSSTELAIYIGYRQGCWPGLILAGVCFILPAMLIVAALACAYVRFGSLPQIAGVLFGVKPVIVAIIAQAAWRLGRTAVKSRLTGFVGLACVVLGLAGVSPLPILFGAGALVATSRVGVVGARGERIQAAGLLLVTALLAVLPHLLTSASDEARPVGIASLFLFFLKVGSVVYGSGYVLVAFLRDDLVAHWHWLTSSQLLDAIAVGQVTPGPVFTTATFIGYVLKGVSGALVSTVGIFLPAFLLVMISGPVIPRIRRSVVAGLFLDGVNVAAVALMAAVAAQLGLTVVTSSLGIALALSSAIALIRFGVGAGWVVVTGAVIGFLAAGPLHLIRGGSP